MKLKRILTLCCMLTMALGMASSASAADYSFETSANPVYYGSTNYGNTNYDDNGTTNDCISGVRFQQFQHHLWWQPNRSSVSALCHHY